MMSEIVENARQNVETLKLVKGLQENLMRSLKIIDGMTDQLASLEKRCQENTQMLDQDAGIPLPPAKRDEIRDKVQTVINTIRDELDDFVGGITRGGAVQERKRRGGRTDEP